ncbi:MULTISPECIES: TetR/AcrR family transcriptional regulator [Actinokineospora]|uniref:TetR family transcriptional regulator n=1 Tax=Actinokineospora fastidiosa TaxID=1816 RepID=A0A918GRJ0_9PSEU|nr:MULTISPECIES: TetR/AcrR family transcriptional regulator [Actinokineospora]UVS80526.1 DNA-binding transcriptional repressor AcrR [Actinokineospora sp. UTMC 2448]GGS54576.1 TetR family transcriptional regulator [Actinokineospora fastidiosa]
MTSPDLGHVATDARARVRRHTKGDRTKERIIDAAADLFAQSGYLAVSLRDIAARAKITHAGLLHHFPGGKDELLIRVLEQRDANDAAVLFDETLSAWEHLDQTVGIVERNARTPGLVALYAKLSNEASDAEHPAHTYFRRRYEILRAHFAAVLGELMDQPGLAPDSAAQQLIALLDGLQTQWLLAPGTIDMRARLIDFLALLGVDTTGWSTDSA